MCFLLVFLCGQEVIEITILGTTGYNESAQKLLQVCQGFIPDAKE
jgi:hypothetical protein